MKSKFLMCSVGLLFPMAPAVTAYEQPAINLGFTNFLDGAPPAGSGFYFMQYGQFWDADFFADSNGDSLPEPPDPNLDAYISLSQFIYQSPNEFLFGAKWGIDVIVPFVSLNLDFAGGSSSNSGIGDVLIGPYLQWDPIMVNGRPFLLQRIEFQTIFPIGDYDTDSLLNPGSNFFSFNPYWTGTMFLSPKWTVSTRVHYLWNDGNDNPTDLMRAPLSFGGLGAINSVRAGQAFHTNFAITREIMANRLHAGLNGYFLKQVTDTEVDGQDLAGTREQVLGLGPGFVYHFSKDQHLFFNAYFETAAENRPKGTRINFRWVHHF